MVLEDLHWADATSLSLVPFLARALRRDPVAFVLTFRPDDEAGSHSLAGLRTELRRGALGSEHLLRPLAPDEAHALLADALGVAPAPEVAAELLRLAAGNPFALQELAAAALESGWIDAASGRRAGAGQVQLPWTLAESIQARAALLGPAERELIAWAAAIGERFDLRLLSAGAGPPPRGRIDPARLQGGGRQLLQGEGVACGQAHQLGGDLGGRGKAQDVGHRGAGLTGRERAEHVLAPQAAAAKLLAQACERG